MAPDFQPNKADERRLFSAVHRGLKEWKGPCFGSERAPTHCKVRISVTGTLTRDIFGFDMLGWTLHRACC